ncbi:MAG: vitamin K epoxide reductase family protein [Anaerolineae bacterium]|nr:MAG: vitamin K epoxide reductase family protein [Anaerolineae bacterium]
MTDQIAKRLVYVLAGIGLLDSLYLAYYKLGNNPVLCTGIGGCDVVNSSPYAVVWGIPIAVLGAGAYLVLILLLALEERSDFVMDYGRMLTLGITLAGTLYSAYLTYIEVAVLKAICPFCVVSAIAMVLLLGVAIWRYRQDTGG